MFIRVDMRFVVAFIIVILSFRLQVSAQERDTLLEIIAPYKSETLPGLAGMPKTSGSASMPILLKDFKSGYEFQNPALPNINFNSMTGWKIETGNSLGIRSIYGFYFYNNPIGLYGNSGWDIYSGFYGVRTYQVNNKLFIGTSGYSDKSLNEYSQKSGYYRQTNYNSSLFVGYKFSEKFSIQAGFSIQRNDDPWNRKLPMQNGGIFP